MSQTRSSSTQQVYGLARVCPVWGVARSTVYATQGCPPSSLPVCRFS
jgi:hypothetical protein